MFNIYNNTLTVKNKVFSWSFENIVSAEEREVTPKSRSLPYFEVAAVREDQSKVSFQTWEDIPVVRISDDSEKVILTLDGEHWTIRAVKLNAFTDDFDTLTEEIEFNLFFKGIKRAVEGDIFFFEPTLSDDAFVLISETPDHIRGAIAADRDPDRTCHFVTLKNGGYPVVVGKCKKGECEALVRAYFRHANACPELITMSNTWGDRNGRERICEEFVRGEIEAAREIGIDVVQVDDGWQAGNTIYEIQKDERGNQVFYDKYWDLNTDRFPNGIKPLSDLAAGYGMRLGLWWAPSSHDCFAKIERDKAVLSHMYREYGARFFKLDMYQALDKAHSDKMLEILAHIYSLGDDVSVQMDVTRYERLNYLCGREYGTIFVENRYTRSGNYFPHRTLRNLWDISKYLPSNRFQFELVNPELNKDKQYHANDPLAPKYYGLDYLFAGVMLSNPLFWTELQFLSAESKAALAPLFAVWKEHRGVLSAADVAPIGEKPCGTSHTGFYVSVDGVPKYLLTFREYTDREEHSFELPAEMTEATLLYSNADVDITADGKKLFVRYSKPRAYAFIKLT